MFGFKSEKTIVDEGQIDELLTRGIENIFPNREFVKAKMMKGEKISIYLGIDPTGPTLHLGHIIPLLRLSKFQKLGHQIILLVGDFTAMIGDPTDKTATRKKLSKEEVRGNLKEYEKQASKFISFSGSNKAILRFNSEWFSKMTYEDAINLASEMTTDQMAKRDMFRTRAAEGKSTYIHEFMYPLMQAYDSVALDVDGEIGGNDQTFNMLAGRDLMKSLKNKEKFVIATKLLVDPTGKKMGKSEDNMVALNQSPEEMFGKVMSWNDDLIVPAFEIITEISLGEVEEIKEGITSGKNPRDFKIRLAREIVSICYGIGDAERAEENFEKTFSKGGVPDDMVEVSAGENTLLVDVLLKEKLVESKTEFRRLVSEGAITEMEKEEKVTDASIVAGPGTYKVGKRRFIKIK
jgi:tyrosyl-tRNA synthetase